MGSQTRRTKGQGRCRSGVTLTVHCLAQQGKVRKIIHKRGKSVGRIGVYFDGFNVYYGARHQFKDQSGSWKWYSPKLLINNLIQDVLRDNTRLSVAARQLWGQGDLVRVVFALRKFLILKIHRNVKIKIVS